MKFFTITIIALLLSWSLSAQNESEPNDGFAQADVLTLVNQKGSIKGSINPKKDKDYYKIEVQSAGVFIINILDIPQNIQMEYKIYDENQQWIERKVCVAGTYYIVLKDTGLYDSSPDLYNLKVTFNIDDQFECNDQISDAAQIELNTNNSAAIFPHRDIDYYKFEVVTPGVIEISVNNVPGNININTFLYNPNQELIFKADPIGGSGVTRYFTIGVCEIGTYYIRLHHGGLHDSSPDLYNIKITVNTDDLYECNNSFNTAYSINTCDKIEAAIYSKNDADFFSINLEENKTVHFSLTNVSDELKPSIKIFNSAQQVVLEKNSYYGTSQFFDFTPSVSDEYYVLVEGTSNSHSPQLYSLLVQDEGCNTTSTQSIAFNNISIYPNPVTNQINIQQLSTQDIMMIKLVKSDGTQLSQTIHPAENTSIDMTNNPSGIYFLVFIDNDGNSYTERIIKI